MSGCFASQPAGYINSQFKTRPQFLSELSSIVCRIFNIIHLAKRVVMGFRITGSWIYDIRKDIALKLVNEYGASLAETARYIGISTSGVAKIVSRG
ncbi:MAG: hypothetical protein KAH06_07375 [Desulfobacterales bacterium]|nr:hypothetical protein [Desulfobacterales bacterium]